MGSPPPARLWTWVTVVPAEGATCPPIPNAQTALTATRAARTSRRDLLSWDIEHLLPGEKVVWDRRPVLSSRRNPMSLRRGKAIPVRGGPASCVQVPANGNMARMRRAEGLLLRRTSDPGACPRHKEATLASNAKVAVLPMLDVAYRFRLGEAGPVSGWLWPWRLRARTAAPPGDRLDPAGSCCR
jgi:hypothetical protein